VDLLIVYMFMILFMWNLYSIKCDIFSFDILSTPLDIYI
jgi:hypothetical protein